MEEVEYLTEWPPQPKAKPRDPKQFAEEKETDLSPPPSKRPRQGGGIELQEEEIALAQANLTLLAGPLLARWWKLRLRDSSWKKEKEKDIPVSCNPSTLLYHIARLPEAKCFLRYRVGFLRATGVLEETSTLAASLASCYQKLGQYGDALEQAEVAVRADPNNRERKWLHELLLRQNKVVEEARELQKKLQVVGGSSLCIPKPAQVERKCVDGLSFQEFLSRYALTHTPVVITGMVEQMTPQPWTLSYIKETIGDKTAPLRKLVEGSVEWARLEPAGESKVDCFIDSLDDHRPGEDLKYLFDWSLPLNCPELARQLRIPRYFAGDFLQRTPCGSLYRDSWPSLFIAPAGIHSELHVDAFGSNFWMALFEGRKRWVFFPPEDIPCLYPVYEHSTDAIFQVDLAHPDLEMHPLLALTHPRECILQPGEILFVPAGCPHRVENLEKSLAISANFVDSSNFEAVVKELRINALVDERAEELLKVFEGEGFDKEMEDRQQQTLCWEEFKGSLLRPS